MKKKGGSWGPNPNSTTIQYSLSGTQASTDAVALDANYISAPAGFSYHCTDAPDMKSANSTEGSNAGSVVFRVREMQVRNQTIHISLPAPLKKIIKINKKKERENIWRSSHNLNVLIENLKSFIIC